MTTQAIITCVILVITMVLLISQKVPLVILGAAIPAALAATGVINAGSAYTEFGNTTIVFFMGLVVVGEAFFKTGLADFIGGKIIGLLGKTEKGLLLGTGLVAGGLSAFLNDTGSTACLMPIVSSMASKAGVKKSKLLMGILRLSGRHHHAGGYHPPHRGKRHPEGYGPAGVRLLRVYQDRPAPAGVRHTVHVLLRHKAAAG